MDVFCLMIFFDKKTQNSLDDGEKTLYYNKCV